MKGIQRNLLLASQGASREISIPVKYADRQSRGVKAEQYMTVFKIFWVAETAPGMRTRQRGMAPDSPLQPAHQRFESRIYHMV